MSQQTLGSLFAGIGGFDLGFERAGFNVRWQVEQDGKAQSVLGHRFPTAKLYDDVRTVGKANLEAVDVICGGFPCQDVSVAGKREGLGGERTGLFWEVVRIAEELAPEWLVLENVPGLLSSRGGRDFHAVLAALADCGFRRSYRILDSRYFGVAQRRRRVFLVLRARRCGDGPAAVLFEPESGKRDSQESDETRPRVAATLRGRSRGAGVNMPGRGGEDDENLVQVSRPLVQSIHKRHDDDTDTLIPTLSASLGHHGHSSPRGDGSDPLVVPTLAGDGKRRPGGQPNDVEGLQRDSSGAVRRLTPLECERLQGFPDGWTCLCGEGHRGSSFCTCGDSHRYRQLGNAVTVNVAEWIAHRLRFAWPSDARAE